MRHFWIIAMLFAATLVQPAYAQGFREVPADTSDEPNLKVTKGSGGTSTSRLIYEAPARYDYVLGDRNAPVMIIEYASFSCPHCAHFSNTVLPQLEKHYVETGKAAYILRPFPLNEPALKAAMLADCVGEQSVNRYYIFSRVLFDAQKKWAFDGNFMSGLQTIANVGGLSTKEFMGCVNNTDREMHILKLKKAANEELKIPHTPYFFIDGEVYGGERTFEAMSKFIDAKLAQKKKK